MKQTGKGSDKAAAPKATGCRHWRSEPLPGCAPGLPFSDGEALSGTALVPTAPQGGTGKNNLVAGFAEPGLERLQGVAAMTRQGRAKPWDWNASGSRYAALAATPAVATAAGIAAASALACPW